MDKSLTLIQDFEFIAPFFIKKEELLFGKKTNTVK